MAKALNDDRPEALLKSALEKIVYFEARSEQVANDLVQSRTEAESLRRELAQAAQREIELRREVAELQVSLGRAHREREEAARVNEALRNERAALIGKLVEASRIQGLGEGEADAGFDLASFIAELRGEVLATRTAKEPALVVARPSTALGANGSPTETRTTGVSAHAERFRAEGRLQVSAAQLEELSAKAGFPGRTEETLFGFSVRELSSPDTSARIRAAERLRSLGTPAAAPALATALHSEGEPEVQVALLSALSALGAKESAGIASRHLVSSSPDVRIAALKALLQLDAAQVGPHLAQAIKDPDRTVRRRASLLALGLSGAIALDLGEQALRDSDPEVRSLAARVLGAAGGDTARSLLLEGLRDPEIKVRRAAAEGLSRILGHDVSAVISLDDAQRRREVRRLATLPVQPVRAPVFTEAVQARAVESLPPAEPELSETLCSAVAAEVRAAIRGRSLAELATVTRAAPGQVEQACELLIARGQMVRRGTKFFAA